jgi:hypothetical protein
MANFYVKKIESGDDAAQIGRETNQASGAILKTNSQVGVFNGSATDFYVNGQLNNAKGKVYNQNAGTNYMPTRSNLNSLIQKETVKSVFNKFFTNSTVSDETHNTSASADGSSNWASAVNLNAFAYMRTNGVEGYKF